MAKLWDKGYSLDTIIERFTVGDDPLLDLSLVVADCFGSLAHVAGLKHAEILSQQEADALSDELRAIADLSVAGEFRIARSQEDCHTAIEDRLVARLGEVGKKVHTGRSRNDQVLTALRLYTRDALIHIRGGVIATARAFLACAEGWEGVPLVGRTHMQPAMPSTLGLWAAAVAESFLDDLAVLDAAYSLVDASPLGSAAGYGVPLRIDRSYVASAMGFAHVQHSVVYAANSRGKVEAAVLEALDQVGLTISKAAVDLLFFSLPEIGYITLPKELCTGSSIMPQKKNPDMLELMRSRAAALGGYAGAVKAMVRHLPGGYNRDFQDTKPPLMAALQSAADMVAVLAYTVPKLEVDHAACLAAFTPEVFATDEALEAVGRGVSFRDAYKQVADSLSTEGGAATVSQERVRSALEKRTGPGTAGNPALEVLYGRLAGYEEGLESARRVRDAAVVRLFGTNRALFRDSATTTETT